MNTTLRRISRIGATVALAITATVACGSDDASAPDTTVPATTAPDTTAPDTTEPGRIDPVGVAVYFSRSAPTRITVEPVRRMVDDISNGLLAATFEAWLAGPSDAEVADGLASAVPEGTELLGVEYRDGLVAIDLSSEFESGGGSASVSARLAEMVMTAATAVIIFEGVELAIEGTPVSLFSPEGIEITGPLTLDDVEDSLAAIVSYSVLDGDEVTDGTQISGWANVFEATVSLQVVDADGELLQEGFTTATCGTGCRGRFVTYIDVGGYTGPATLRLFESSPKDGSETGLVEAAITIVAG